jgi:enoyl-CoA hydratase/carnithine racemase
MPAAALGLHYYPSGLRRYVTRFGLQMSKRAFLTGQPIPYEALHKLGVFETLVTSDEFENSVQNLVRTLISTASLALSSTKKSLNEIAAGLYNEPALKERSRQSVYSEDFAEGRAAFAQRRSPRFTGK